MNRTANIKNFVKKYHENYNFLYENRDNVAGYAEAVNAFDYLIHNNANFDNFVAEFCKYTDDFIAGDREAAAFAFTCEDFGLLDGVYIGTYYPEEY